MLEATETKPNTGGLEVRLYLTNGGRQRFVQTDPVTAHDILTPLRPDRIFAQEHLVFSGLDSATILPTANIERIEMRSDSLSQWAHSTPIGAVREIRDEDFQRIQRREPPVPQLVLGRPVPGTPPSELGIAVELRSGAILYLRVYMQTPPGSAPMPIAMPEDTRLLLQHLFARHALFGQTADEKGSFLINPANVVRFTLAPPPYGVIAGAWSMDSMIF